MIGKHKPFTKNNLAAPRILHVAFLAKCAKQRVVRLLTCNFHCQKTTWIPLLFSYKRITVQSGLKIATGLSGQKRLVSEK